jgi:hypothetical protein
MRAAGREATRSACRQAAAKAKRTVGGFDDTGGDLDELEAQGANSALAKSRVAGMTSRTASINQ